MDQNDETSRGKLATRRSPLLAIHICPSSHDCFSVEIPNACLTLAQRVGCASLIVREMILWIDLE
jgi:hypothetical protein